MELIGYLNHLHQHLQNELLQNEQNIYSNYIVCIGECWIYATWGNVILKL